MRSTVSGKRLWRVIAQAKQGQPQGEGLLLAKRLGRIWGPTSPASPELPEYDQSRFQDIPSQSMPSLEQLTPVNGEFNGHCNSDHLEVEAWLWFAKILALATSDRNVFREDGELWSFRLHRSQRFETLSSSFVFPSLPRVVISKQPISYSLV